MIVQQKFIKVEGSLIRYFQAGTEGFPLVLLHGTGDSAIDWSLVLPILGQNYRVYAPDFPGHGESDKPIREYSLSFLTKFVIGFLDALDLTSVVLVGNSLGGLVALLSALSHQERIEALGLVDSAGLGQWVSPFLCGLTLPIYGDIAVIGCQTPVGAILRARTRSVLLFAHPEKIPLQWYVEQERMAQSPASMYAVLSSLRAHLSPFGQRFILLDALKQLQIPTLLMWGTNDLIVPKTQAEIAVKYLQQGELVLFPDCGHVPPLEQPESFSTALNQFLTKKLINKSVGRVWGEEQGIGYSWSCIR